MSLLSMQNTFTPQELLQRQREGGVAVVDVREYAEYAGGRIGGSILVPLAKLTEQASRLPRDKEIVLVCRSGKRSREALNLLEKEGFTEVHQLEGGLQAWEAAGLPVVRDSHAPWSIERQVRLIAGLLILAGLAASHFWAPAIVLAWFVPAGLVFAALTDTCMMGTLLSKLPWNKPARGASCARS